MDFNKVIEQLESNYYSELVMLCTELTALIIGLLYIRKDKAGQFFIAYIAFDFCILLADFFFTTSTGISKKFTSGFINTTNTLIAFIELLVYFQLFLKILDSQKIKKILAVLTVIYCAIIIIFLSTKFSFITSRYNYISNITGTIEFVFLLIPCIYYFLQLFKTNSPLPLTDRPSFWIVIGIFLYSLISIPYYLLYSYIVNSHLELRQIFNACLYYIPFTANFIFLIKAFLCKKPLTI
jgi:hypothetical protein